MTYRSPARELSDQELAEVAEVYKTALARRKPTERAVAEAFVIPTNYAREWIRATRRAGLLPPPRVRTPKNPKPQVAIGQSNP